MSRFQSTKVFDGYSCCFRQWAAENTACQYLHGYGVSFKIWFEGELDHRNWVWDFGGLKRSTTQIDGMSGKEWVNYMFDHTVIIAEDDPFLQQFDDLHKAGVIQLRVLPSVGAEKFAEFLYNKLQPFVQEETDGRVDIVKVEFREHGKNSAIYTP